MTRKNPEYYQLGTKKAHQKLSVPSELTIKEIKMRPTSIRPEIKIRTKLDDDDLQSMHLE